MNLSRKSASLVLPLVASSLPRVGSSNLQNTLITLFLVPCVNLSSIEKKAFVFLFAQLLTKCFIRSVAKFILCACNETCACQLSVILISKLNLTSKTIQIQNTVMHGFSTTLSLGRKCVKNGYYLGVFLVGVERNLMVGQNCPKIAQNER